jgi:uncharacterized protein (DUF924 family)
LDAVTPERIAAFWRDAGPDKWFGKSDAFDAEIRTRFLKAHEAAASGALAAWESNAESALALLILLDQFPRNMFRGTPRAFATDEKARAVADRAIANRFDAAVAPGMRSFFYLPFMHSEELADQERCIALYLAAQDDDGLKWAREHADIIRRFGRFPHRNATLGRNSTPNEKAFLDGGSFSG